MSEINHALLGLSAIVVAAYVKHNSLPQAELVGLIEGTHAALTGLGTEPEPAAAEKPVPAVSIKKSITPDAIICLEDGKAFKSLKRHLRAAYDMTPDQYRAKWGLSADYPMVAPSYAEARSALANQSRLIRPFARSRTASAVAGRVTCLFSVFRLRCDELRTDRIGRSMLYIEAQPQQFGRSCRGTTPRFRAAIRAAPAICERPSSMQHWILPRRRASGRPSACTTSLTGFESHRPRCSTTTATSIALRTRGSCAG